jgi:hypothetical protein
MKWPLFILFVHLAVYCSAQDSSETIKKFELRGYVKNLQSLSFDKNFNELIAGDLIHNRLNVKWRPSSQITAVAEFRNRLFWGEEIRLRPGFASLLKNPNEELDLQKVWIETNSLVLHTNTERLFFDFGANEVNVRVGRQRINWGMTNTWNPNDIFNSYNFLDFDYEERPGVDGGKLRYVFDNSGNAEIAYAGGGKNKGGVAALKYAMNKWHYDMQLIAGWYNDRLTLGAGWAGNIKDAGFKGEAQYYFGKRDSTDRLNISVEGDYVFKNGWYMSVAMLFNNRGLHKPEGSWDSINLELSAENLMPTKWNMIITAVKELTPLFSLNASGMYAPGTNLLILFPSLQYSLAASLDVSLVWQSFFAQLGNNFEAFNHRGFLRAKWSF